MSRMAAATLGGNIKKLRQAAGYEDQGPFVEALGASQSQVSGWENDRYGTMQTKTLLRIAKLLKLPLNDFVVGIDPEYDVILLPHHGSCQQQQANEARIKDLEQRLSNVEHDRDDLRARLARIRGEAEIETADAPQRQKGVQLP